MRLVQLHEKRNRELVTALEGLLLMAKSGEISGLAYVVKFGHQDHRAGIAGSYEASPVDALTATFMLERHTRGRLERVR